MRFISDLRKSKVKFHGKRPYQQINPSLILYLSRRRTMVRRICLFSLSSKKDTWLLGFESKIKSQDMNNWIIWVFSLHVTLVFSAIKKSNLFGQITIIFIQRLISNVFHFNFVLIRYTWEVEISRPRLSPMIFLGRSVAYHPTVQYIFCRTESNWFKAKDCTWTLLVCSNCCARRTDEPREKMD